MSVRYLEILNLWENRTFGCKKLKVLFCAFFKRAQGLKVSESDVLFVEAMQIRRGHLQKRIKGGAQSGNGGNERQRTGTNGRADFCLWRAEF